MKDISNFKNNNIFYSDFKEDFEIEYIFEIKQKKEYNIHVWEGYIDDIFNHPTNNVENERRKNDDWSGMTYDWQYNLLDEKEINLEEYYKDLLNYKDAQFNIKETSKVLELLLLFFKFALENNYIITIYKK